MSPPFRVINENGSLTLPFFSSAQLLCKATNTGTFKVNALKANKHAAFEGPKKSGSELHYTFLESHQFLLCLPDFRTEG